ncbi:STAS domain-containing protein [Neobacillus terrae]|uniref:STAS domain-containing protein n=1 Tax=Neobacillus terrae TaxID=3034837 RepID=UPI0014085266|nr:STAS domain-containing protein [Neobacillus terrae]NHM33540.1 STAS domain-containing protein [Neobacillus terrae]
MNPNTQALYEYLIEHASEVTKDWASYREVKEGSDYSADAPPEVANKVTDQNTGYVKVVAQCLLQTTEEMKDSISKWTKQTAADRVKSNTSLTEVAKNSGIFREVYWKKIRKFIKETDLKITIDDLLEWERKINYTLDYVLETFTSVFMDILLDRLKAQSNLIMELSSPIIPISDHIGLLPLIGDIDTARAKWIMESTLEQSVNLKITQLIIDFSGVAAVDTMVTHKLIQVVQSLKLVGVTTTFLGIRPEVAQTAVNLGFNLNNIRAENSLKNVLKNLQLES